MTGIPEYLRGDIENLVTILMRMGDADLGRLRRELRDRVRADRWASDPFDSFDGMAFILVTAEDDHRADTLAAMEDDLGGVL